jgi:hypothetical protein
VCQWERHRTAPVACRHAKGHRDTVTPPSNANGTSSKRGGNHCGGVVTYPKFIVPQEFPCDSPTVLGSSAKVGYRLSVAAASRSEGRGEEGAYLAADLARLVLIQQPEYLCVTV